MKFDELNVNLKDLYDKDKLTVADVASLFKDIIDGISREYPGGVDAVELGDAAAVKNAATYLSAAAHGLLSIYNNNKERLSQSTRVQVLRDNRQKTFDSLEEADKYLNELKDQMLQTNRISEELKTRMDELLIQNAEYDDALKRYDSLLNETKEKQNIISNLEEKLRELEQKKEQLTKRFDELDCEKNSMDTELSGLEEEIRIQQIDHTNLSNELAGLKEKYANKQGQVNELCEKVDEFKTKIIPKLEMESEKLETEHMEQTKIEQSLNEKIKENIEVLIPDVKNRTIESEKELHQLEQELSDAQGTLEINEGLIKSKAGEFQNLKDEISRQLNKKSELDLEVSKMQQNQADLQEQIDKLSNDLSKLYDPEKYRDVDRCKNSCDRLKNVVSKLFSVSSLGYGNVDPQAIYQKRIQMQRDLDTATNILNGLFSDYNMIREVLEK